MTKERKNNEQGRNEKNQNEKKKTAEQSAVKTPCLLAKSSSRKRQMSNILVIT